MIKVNYVNSAYCKIAACILKRREYKQVVELFLGCQIGCMHKKCFNYKTKTYF